MLSNEHKKHGQKVRAPVLIGTYTRLDHLKKSIDALAKNTQASETDLYIASDFSASEKDRSSVDDVRSYIKTISGFRSLNLILRPLNYGSYRNYTEATEFIFQTHDRIIIMEDDIVTGVGFLEFINDGLELYGVDSNVFGVTGYMWPNIKIDIDSDTVLLPLYNGWGSAFHRENYKKIVSGRHVAQKVVKSFFLFLRANMVIPGIAPLVFEMARGKLAAWDIDCYLYVIENKKYVLLPKKSLVKNIGFDGTGLRCGVDAAFSEQDINNDRTIAVRRLSPGEIAFCGKHTFSAFGGLSSFLKGYVIFYMKRFLPEYLFLRALSFKQKIMRVLRGVKNENI
jgi:hypothetical protein